MRKAVLVVALVLVAGGLALWLWQKAPLVAHEGVLLPSSDRPWGGAEPSGGASPLAPQAVATVSPAFLQFVAQEARALDGTTVDTASAEKRLQAQADAMSLGEVEHLKELALGKANPANQKILGVHLLGKAGLKAWPALLEILKAPVAQEAPPQHSVEEVRWMQERALREMSLEALLEQASRDPRALELLREAVEKISDPSFAARVRKKLQDLEPASR